MSALSAAPDILSMALGSVRRSILSAILMIPLQAIVKLVIPVLNYQESTVSRLLDRFLTATARSGMVLFVRNAPMAPTSKLTVLVPLLTLFAKHSILSMEPAQVVMTLLC